MRSFGIVKLNIGGNTGLKCSIGRMFSSIEFFFFQRCEEWFCDRIVMWLAGLRKRLLRIVFMQELLETMWGVLRSSVAMKNKTRRWLAFLICHFECCGDKLRTIPFWNLICDYFTGEEINDHADIKIVISEFKTANIADPPLIWLSGSKLLL